MSHSSARPGTAAHQVPLSMGIPRQEYWSGLPCPPPVNVPNPEIKSRSPTLRADSFPAEPQGKPKNTGVGSLSLQQIFPTQELSRGFLHCRWILYQLSYQGSPDCTVEVTNRFKGFDLIACLKNYGQRFITLYRRQWTKSPQRKRNARSKVVVWGGFTNSWGKKRSEKQGREGKIYPIECRVAENNKIIRPS